MLRIPAVLLCLFAISGWATRAQAKQKPDKTLNVTDGEITAAAEGRLEVRSKEMRATLKSESLQNITVRFTYLGPTKEVSRLGSGEIRHQFGLKLKAQDTCNLIYVMWHFDENDNRVAVSVKFNPGQEIHQQCLDHGYINNIPADYKQAAPIVKAGEPHALAASLDGRKLTVMADNKVVWEGALPEIVLSFRGPVGFRSDNAHVVFDYTIGK